MALREPIEQARSVAHCSSCRSNRFMAKKECHIGSGSDRWVETNISGRRNDWRSFFLLVHNTTLKIWQALEPDLPTARAPVRILAKCMCMVLLCTAGSESAASIRQTEAKGPVAVRVSSLNQLTLPAPSSQFQRVSCIAECIAFF